MRLWPLVAVALASSSFVAACGGAAYESKAPSAEPTPHTAESEPATVAEATARVDQARAELDQALHAPSATPAQPTQPQSQPSHVPMPGTEPAGVQPESPCARACRAFASMERAVAAVCRLAGDADAKCTSAKKVLDENMVRVKACACR
ncbi:MAG: hypothetical protein HOO96_44920 [Polyangiaceae bacterium]|nr:hypothetical protein [Polyangiaceae bacterium]